MPARLALAVPLIAAGLVAQAEPANNTLMRYPTLYGNTIVFSAHDNLWSVPRTGGVAARLTAEGGRDVMPRFSPDGRWIAFTGEYQGNRDVYVMPSGGGAAKRLTFVSDIADEPALRWGPNNMVVSWTPDSSSDGKKVLYKLQKDYLIAEAAAPGKTDPESKKTLDLSHMRVRTDPRQEWAEMFHSAWRLERDLFYSDRMNGVDWDAVHAAYGKLLPLVGSRSDLNFLIGEVLGELGNSHTYVSGGDDIPEEQRVPTAFLGADLALEAPSGRYRIARIFTGDNTRETYRSPLTAPGLEVHAGEYLLAIDGQELQAPLDPYSLLVGKEGVTIRLTLAETPAGKRRDVVVQPVKNELPLREQAWIDHKRQLVDQASGGRIAYIYLSDMGGRGMDQFVRQFYPQMDKQALIFDDRWNGGGFIDAIVLERLRRVLVGMETNREAGNQTQPNQLIIGPKICLINHYSASDGDIFPYYFRKYGLGPLLGTRTWGGVRGIRGDWILLDGGYITIPETAVYDLDSQWAIENHGVDPDLPVDDTPADWLRGHDVQLEAAVSYLRDEMQKHPASLPPAPPPLPAYPPAR